MKYESYIFDLDGTLLRRDQTVSPFTAETINTLTARGMPVPMGRPQQTGLSGALHSPAIDAVLAGIVLHNRGTIPKIVSCRIHTSGG